MPPSFLSPGAALDARWLLVVLALLFSALAPGHALAQDALPPAPEAAAETNTAMVEIDGVPLFRLRGISSYPASRRVEAVRDRIIAAARDENVKIEDIRLDHKEDRTTVLAGDTVLLEVLDVDAELEAIPRKTMAEVAKLSISTAIQRYRTERTAAVLWNHTLIALALTAGMFVLMWILLRILRRVEAWAAAHVQKRLEGLAEKAHQLIRVKQVWTLIEGLLRTVRFVVVALIIYFYLNTVLGLYPWTRAASLILFDLVLNPLESLWTGFLAAIPKLAFLAVLYVVVRYVLKITRMFFEGVDQGSITLRKFDKDWALPTYKIVRVVIVAFSLVVAYPYIPGSDSLAFKGVSLFLGVMFSLGSTSFISNMLAGLAMTYRAIFKVGDIVRIGDVVGRVEEINLMITRVKTPKNESVAIPNSNILNADVVSFSALARSRGLILHSQVGIGYDAPWRQVEAMLLLAAKRTGGLMTDPPPFVLQRALGDFTVTYEINAYCNDPALMMALYSKLHANIQDVFNEHGVQIMSPNYESDPASPKLVPPDKWYSAPAVPPSS